jgi:hypothetical protein
MRAYHTLVKFVLLASVADIAAAASEECSVSIDLNKSSYGPGEDIAVTLNQCHTDKEDFLAIYDASVDLNDINGAVNYRMWMRTCGSQYCNVATTDSRFSFGEVNNKHTWPLPIGKYRAHLVKRDANLQFSSFASSPVFTVDSLPKEQAEKFFNIEVSRNLKATHQDCIDYLATSSNCYEAGGIITMTMTSECTQVSHSDWIGIYNDEPNKDDMYFGEPSVWLKVCHEGDCHHLTSASYHSNLSHHKELQDGNYRLALVRKGYKHQGPYKAQLVSESFQVRTSNEKCKIKAEDTTF